MAKIVGTITTSHVPAIGGAIAKGLQNDPYWKPFFDGFPPVREWLAQVKPDVIVLVYNDHGLNFFLDKMPTFAVGAADEYRNADEGWGIPTVPPFRGDFGTVVASDRIAGRGGFRSRRPVRRWRSITPSPCRWRCAGPTCNWPVRTMPVCVNTVQGPLPSVRRAATGSARRSGGRSRPGRGERRVVVMGTGGLSHQLDGERAGFINKDFDLKFMDAIAVDVSGLGDEIFDARLVELAGTQGVELLNWVVSARHRCRRRVNKKHATLTTFRSRTRRRRSCCCRTNQLKPLRRPDAFLPGRPYWPG